MSNKTKYIIWLLLLIVVGVLMPAKPCLAASAEVAISADKEEVTVGDRIHIYINIDSDTSFGSFEANLTYDDELLQYNEGSAVVKGNSGFLKISDMNVPEGDTARKYSMEFEALKVGVCELSFSGRVIVYDFDSDQEMSVSSNVLTLNIKAPVTASTNARLKSLKTSPAQITPSFDPGVYEYNVNVGYDTDQLVIVALPADSTAKVSISGNDFLKEGENKVVIKVLAESGDFIEYSINVMRASVPQGDTEEDTEELPDEEVDSFEIIQEEDVRYIIFSGKYILKEPDSSVRIPEGYQLSSLTISNITIPAYLPEDNEASDFILIYAENEYGNPGFYQYDRIEKTLQRYVPAYQSIKGNTNQGQAAENGSGKGKENLTAAVVVISLLSGFCAILIFVSVRMFFKLKGYQEDDLG